jgi:hypothetical protein
MGGSSSKEQAETCKFTKVQFNYLLSIIQDAHYVMQFYASAKLLTRVPIRFTEYRVYSAQSEEYFNPFRNDGPGNYYETYLYIKNFQNMYDGLVSETERSAALDKAFSSTYAVLQRLVQDLSNTCMQQVQGV